MLLPNAGNGRLMFAMHYQPCVEESTKHAAQCVCTLLASAPADAKTFLLCMKGQPGAGVGASACKQSKTARADETWNAY